MHHLTSGTLWNGSRGLLVSMDYTLKTADTYLTFIVPGTMLSISECDLTSLIRWTSYSHFTNAVNQGLRA